jgi:hypothetical protein
MSKDRFGIVYSDHASEWVSLRMGETGAELIQSPTTPGPFDIVSDGSFGKVTVLIGIIPYCGCVYKAVGEFHGSDFDRIVNGSHFYPPFYNN